MPLTAKTIRPWLSDAGPWAIHSSTIQPPTAAELFFHHLIGLYPYDLVDLVILWILSDVFNLVNAWTPLRRQNDYRFTGPNGFNQILEIMNPLVVRLGASVTF